MTARDDAAPHEDTRREPLFYAGPTIDEATLLRAMRVEGIDEEIGALRARLKDVIDRQPDAVAQMLRGMELLVRAVAARYRMSPKSRDEFADAVSDVLTRLGEQIAPERFHDV
jgi:hypothetical protein